MVCVLLAGEQINTTLFRLPNLDYLPQCASDDAVRACPLSLVASRLIHPSTPLCVHPSLVTCSPLLHCLVHPNLLSTWPRSLVSVRTYVSAKSEEEEEEEEDGLRDAMIRCVCMLKCLWLNFYLSHPLSLTMSLCVCVCVCVFVLFLVLMACHHDNVFY